MFIASFDPDIEADALTLFDHSVVMNNHHEVNNAWQDDPCRTEINRATWSPDIGYWTFAGGVNGVSTDSNCEIVGPGLTEVLIELDASYIPTITSTGAFIYGGLGVLDVGLGRLASGGLGTPITTHEGEGIAFVPVGGLVDAGDDELRSYTLAGAAAAMGSSLILFEQRDNPFSRLAGPRIDVGAIELQTTAPSALPKVVDVRLINTTINESLNTYSYAQNVGGGDGDQMRAALVSGADTIEVWFNKAVDVLQGSLQLNPLRPLLVGETLPTVAQFTTLTKSLNGVNYHVGRWTLSGNLPNGQFLITIPDTVQDLSGMMLDGDWWNPASVDSVNTQISSFPSGNNVEGGKFAFAFTNLFSTNNLFENEYNQINHSELDALLGNWGAGISGPLVTGGAAVGDFSGDGRVDQGDLDLLLGNWGLDYRKLAIADGTDSDFTVDQDDFLNRDGDRDGITNEAIDTAIYELQFGLEFRYAGV